MGTLIWFLIACGLLSAILANSSGSRSKTKYNYDEWFDRVRHNTDNLINFLSRLQNDDALCEFVESQTGAVLKYNGKIISDPKDKLKQLLLKDVVKCYTIMGYSPSSNSKRSIPFFLFYSKLTDPDIKIGIENIDIFMEKCKESFCSISSQLVNSVSKSSDILFIAEYLKHYDLDVMHEYVRILLEFGYKVAGAEGKVSKADDQKLDIIFNYTRVV